MKLSQIVFSASLVAPAAGCLAPAAEVTDTDSQAVTGDYTDQATHYGFAGDGDVGQSGDVAAIFVGKVTNLTQLNSDLTATLGFSCTNTNGCYTPLNKSGGSTLPSGANDDQASDDAVSAIAGLKEAGAALQIKLFIGDDKSASTLGTMVGTGLGALPALPQLAVFTFGAASNDPVQSTINGWFNQSGHLGVVPVAAVGMITAQRAVLVGGTTYTGNNADTVATGSPGSGVIMSRISSIPRQKQGNAVTLDSIPWAIGAIAGRLDNETDGNGPANLADLQAADSSHFRAVSGGSQVFVDGQPLR